MTDLDKHIGSFIRTRRRELGMTQTQLAQKIGVRFQQVQINETATNRVSASRLWRIADALDVPIVSFFEGLPTGNMSKLSSRHSVDWFNQIQSGKQRNVTNI